MTRLRKLLSEILEIPDDQITDELSPKDVETWDSFCGLAIVVRLEEEFAVELTMDEVMSIKCVRDIRATLKKHGVDFSQNP